MILVGKQKEGHHWEDRRLRRRWKDTIKMDLREIERGGMDWIHLVHDRDQWRAVVNMVMNFWVPLNVGKFLSS
jgi:hypothetical protein